MKKLGYFLLFFTFLSFILLFPASVLAIPTLGMVPYTVADINNSDSFDDFLGYSVFVTGTGVSDILAWYGEDNGRVDTSIEVFLLTNASNGVAFTLDGDPLVNVYQTTSQIDGYHEYMADFNDDFSYYSISLGSVDDGLNSGDWSLLNPELTNENEWPGEWYYYTGTIDIPGIMPGEDVWLFAVADINGDSAIGEPITLSFDPIIITGGEFSPQTTSTNIPEPATMLLLGSGLIGLAGIGRKKFRNQ